MHSDYPNTTGTGRRAAAAVLSANGELYRLGGLVLLLFWPAWKR